VGSGCGVRKANRYERDIGVKTGLRNGQKKNKSSEDTEKEASQSLHMSKMR
jgi:hypothetical protein